MKRVDGATILREGWGARQVLKSLPCGFGARTSNRGHIYVRPAGAHGLSLVDDLKAAATRADERRKDSSRRWWWRPHQETFRPGSGTVGS